MKVLMPIEIFNHEYNIYCSLEIHSICQQAYWCNACSILYVLKQNLLSTHAQLLIIFMQDSLKDSVISQTNNNQKKQGEEKM